MKVKLIAAGCVLAAIVGLCLYAMWTVQTDAETMRNLGTRAAAAVEVDDFAAADAALDELFMFIDDQRAKLEVLALHEDINAISSHVAEARVWLRYQHKEEFAASMAELMESLTLLDERQRLTWSNLF